MQQLPYNAKLRSYNAIRTSNRQRGSDELCITCFEPLGESSYKVEIPSQQIAGIWYRGHGTRCCSQECALSWLESVTLEPASSAPEENRKPITDTLPTQEKRDVWVYAFCEKSDFPESTERCGKWLIFLSPKNIDAYWQRIKQAVEQGRLWSQAKASTAASGTVKRGGAHVICVYTYDYADSVDARRIRETLRELGIQRPIKYKADEDTLNDRYGSDYTPIYYE